MIRLYTELKKQAKKVLERNSKKHNGYSYFVSDYKKYPFQFYWDSCLQAVAMSIFDGKRAEDEIYSLLSKQFPDGCMPYMTAWEKPSFPWSIFIKAANWIGSDGRANLSTAPMLSAFATWEIYKRTENKSFLEKVVPELAREADYLGVQRDLLDDGLVVIVHPLESGTDESPVYDEIMRIPRPKGLRWLSHFLFYAKVSLLMRRYRSVDYDLEKISNMELFLVEDMTSNSIFTRSLRAMGEILSEIGEREAARIYIAQAEKIAKRLEEKCWDEIDGIFYTRYGTRKERKFAKVKTASGLLPIFTGIIEKGKVDMLIEKHLKNSLEFWTPYPISFVSTDEPSHKSGVLPFPWPTLWRGNTWMIMNWMITIGLLEYGYKEIARDITNRSAEMISRSGFREFYNSFSGRGYGARNIGMATSIVDMIERCSS